jgi:hypothetical protein
MIDYRLSLVAGGAAQGQAGNRREAAGEAAAAGRQAAA